MSFTKDIRDQIRKKNCVAKLSSAIKSDERFKHLLADETLYENIYECGKTVELTALDILEELIRLRRDEGIDVSLLVNLANNLLQQEKIFYFLAGAIEIIQGSSKDEAK
jgi:hypothetical protein